MREVYSTLSRISAFIFVGFVAITGGDYGNLIVSKYFNESNKESINVVLLKIASDVNESLPITVNSEISLVSTKSDDGMFRYNYQLINYTSTDAPQEVINSTKQYAFNQFCSEKDINNLGTMTWLLSMPTTEMTENKSRQFLLLHQIAKIIDSQ